MAEVDRVLKSTALALVRSEGVRVVKAPPVDGLMQEWAPGWDDWDEVLVAEGAGSRPAVFAIWARSETTNDGMDMTELYESLAQRVSEIPLQGAPAGLTIRAVAIFCLANVDPHLARRLARQAPRQYYAGIRPELWVIDLSTMTLYGPRSVGFLSSRAQSAVRSALSDPLRQGYEPTTQDFAAAQRESGVQREAFVAAIRGNVPYVTYAVLAACWFVFALEARAHPGCWLDATGNACQAPHIWLPFGAMQAHAVEHGQWWRLFTDMFVHFGLLHILFNSIALWSVGSLVERIYGSYRYALIYFVSGILASVASFVWMAYILNQPYEVAGGASGAIFGIAGVVIVLGIRRESIVPKAVALQLSITMGALIVMNLVFDFFTPGIDYRAHIGGLLVGIVMGYFLMPTPRSRGTEALQS